MPDYRGDDWQEVDEYDDERRDCLTHDEPNEEDPELEAELAQDYILAQQELEDFEGINPFEDYDCSGEW